jgi:integrase
MGVNIWINRNSVYLDIYVRGQRKREKLEGLVLVGDKATDKETLRLAEIAKAKRAQQVFSGEWELGDKIAASQTLYSFLKNNTDKSKKRKCKSTVSTLKHLDVYPGGKTIQLSQITDKWIIEFQNYLLAKFAPNTVINYTGIIRAAINVAFKKNILIRNPLLNAPKVKVPETRKVWLTADELKSLAETSLNKGSVNNDSAEETRRAFLFACFTGLRISDIKTLTWGDIEYSPPQIIKRQQKTAEQVAIPLNSSAWKLLYDGSIHDYRERIFPCLANIQYAQYYRIQKWAKKAGLKKHIGWHTARHTFAVMALESGADLYTVSKLLGHKDIKTTQIYAKVTDKLKRAAVDALPAVELS